MSDEFLSVKHHKEIRKQFCGVLTRYDKTFHDEGIDANLNEWAKNKLPLVDMLRKHPKWDEEAKAVVVPFVERLDAYCNQALREAQHILDYARSIEKIDYHQYRGITSLFEKILVQDNIPTITDDSLNNLCRGVVGVDAPVGQKTTRLVQAIFKKIKVSELAYYKQYFPVLSDYISPIIKDRLATLSVHPCDFLEMTNKDNTWTTCTKMNKGQHCVSSLAYMNDGATMVFSVIADDADAPLFAAPKKRRVLVSFNDGRFAMSRLYPDGDNITRLRDDCAAAIKEIIATSNGYKNKWRTIKSVGKIGNVVCRLPNSYAYYEFNVKHCNPRLVELSKHQFTSLNIFVGDVAYCIDCGKPLKVTDRLTCIECNGDRQITCGVCGKRVDEHLVFYDNDNQKYQCPDCYKCCAHCSATIDLVKITDDSDDRLNVCPSCLKQYTACPVCGRLRRHIYSRSPRDDYEKVCNRCMRDAVMRAIEERKSQFQQNQAS